MRFLNLFKKKKSTRVIPTINNVPLDSFKGEVYENKFPWSDDLIKDTNLTIGNIVMLWWLDKYHGKKRAIPLYFEKNYVHSFEDECKKMINSNWIYSDGSLTQSGKTILQDNFHIIEKHRSAWMSPDELLLKKIDYEQNLEEMIRDFEKLGMNDLAKEKKNLLEQVRKEDKVLLATAKAEDLSKKGEIDKSNAILENLIDSGETDQYSRVYNRLAINYRKQKRFQDEIDICNRFLKFEQPKYGGDSWIDHFENRIHRATLLKNKTSNNKN